MILLINTTERSDLTLGLCERSEVRYYKHETMKQSEDILNLIEDLLKKEKLSTNDISAILVHEGPGSYTGTRIGIVVANTLAWTLNKPVLSFNNDNISSVSGKVKRGDKYSGIVLPKYSTKPF